MQIATVTALSVNTIYVPRLLEIIFGGNWWKTTSCDQANKAVRHWCRDNGALYYVRDKDDMFSWNARKDAASVGLSTVVIDDLP